MRATMFLALTAALLWGCDSEDEDGGGAAADATTADGAGGGVGAGGAPGGGAGGAPAMGGAPGVGGQPGAGGAPGVGGAVGFGGAPGVGGSPAPDAGAPGVSGGDGAGGGSGAGGAPPGCVPDCAGRMCGDDGCDGTCGACDEGACVDGQCASPPGGAACADGPEGNAVGQVLPSLTLMDCDGTPHDLRDLCGSDAAWIFEFAAWCPPCRSFARNMNARLADYAGEDLAVYMVISADANFSPPDAADCRAIREQYGLQIPVLYDPNGDFQRVFGVPDNDVHVVLDGDGTITLKEHYASEAEVYDAIDAALAD